MVGDKRMKLKIYNKKLEEEFVEVSYWSFMKCNFLTYLGMYAIITGAYICLLILAVIAGVLLAQKMNLIEHLKPMLEKKAEEVRARHFAEWKKGEITKWR